ncbi:hypothetical protein N219_01445 [Limosilactobacillus fermentum MTCC 8711]|nr:hypothetical protein N219_01445 [Limosilactobacillus fermentum MTCC 8711]
MSQSGYKVSDLVKAAEVSRQAYYKWLTHEPTVHDIQDQEILKLIKQLEAQHKHCVGWYYSPVKLTLIKTKTQFFLSDQIVVIFRHGLVIFF